jgi:hypothetical protein
MDFILEVEEVVEQPQLVPLVVVGMVDLNQLKTELLVL